MQDVQRVVAALQRPNDVAHEMDHVRVLLDPHELGDFHGAKLRHAADVVAAEVDQHHVLGTLLRILLDVLFDRPVLRFGSAARARPRDGAVVDAIALDAHQHLRR